MRKCVLFFLFFVAALIIAASLDKSSDSIKDFMEMEPQELALKE